MLKSQQHKDALHEALRSEGNLHGQARSRPPAMNHL